MLVSSFTGYLQRKCSNPDFLRLSFKSQNPNFLFFCLSFLCDKIQREDAGYVWWGECSRVCRQTHDTIPQLIHLLVASCYLIFFLRRVLGLKTYELLQHIKKESQPAVIKLTVLFNSSNAYAVIFEDLSYRKIIKFNFQFLFDVF